MIDKFDIFDIDTIKSLYKTMARNYFATKEREKQYRIIDQDDCYSLYPFSDEEIASMKTLREKYGEDEFIKHLGEIFDEETLGFIDSEYVDSIIIDRPTYRYTFGYHEIKDNGVYSSKFKIELSDETYIKLLELHLYDKDMNLNILKYADENLYNILSSEIDGRFREDSWQYCITRPFAITMDELKEDAQKIREQYPDKFPKNQGTRYYNPIYPYHSES